MSDPTDPPVPPSAPEELASAYVDGELSPEARRSVEADPELLAMVAAHTAARNAVATPVAGLSEGERARLVATALDAWRPVAGSGEVVALDSARRARSRRLVQVAAGALASVAAAGVLALVISRNDPGGSGEANTSATTVVGDAAAAAAEVGGGSVEAAERSASTTAVAAQSAPAPAAPGTEAPAGAGDATFDVRALADLGPLANRPEVIAAARPYATTVPPEGPGVCADYPPPLATATFKGTPAYLVIVEVSSGGNRLALVDVSTCAVLVKVDLAGS